MKYPFFLILLLMFTSCKQQSQLFIPPVYLGISDITPSSITLAFDSPVHLSNIVLDPALTLTKVDAQTIFFSGTTAAQTYHLEATASQGITSLAFALQFIGLPQTKPVPVLLNELSIIHNKTTFNAIELRALASGNLAGTTIYLGTPQEYRARYIFAHYPVKAGNLIILNADKPQGLFFVDAPKLGNTREVISIASSPYAVPYFAIAYEKASARESQSAQKRTFDRNVAYLIKHDLWQGLPIDSEFVTATRSLNRRVSPINNPETANRWYVTQTRGITMGSPNNPNVHQPKAVAK